MREGNGVAGGRIVSADDVRGFSAGDFQTQIPDVVEPGLAGRKGDFAGIDDPTAFPIGGDVLMVEHIAPAEPGLVDEVVLCIAYPCRGEDFRHALNPALLGIPGFEDAGHDDVAVPAGDALRLYRVKIPVAFAQMGIIVRGPEDVLLPGAGACRMVDKQCAQQLRGELPDEILGYVC